ncbi:Uncharacterised protein [Mycobacteroides abscessus subsp. abscessus]|nr:Uncharacterised protein [Mycobacteroides abscessus subsp. abscessus]
MVGFGGDQPPDVAARGCHGAGDLLGVSIQRLQGLGQDRAPAQLADEALFAVHPVAQGLRAAPP